MAVFTVKEVAFAAESSFGENANSLSSNTWDKRIPVTSVNMTLDQTRGDDGSIQNRINDSRPGFRGLRSATVELTTVWPGHSGDPTGALTQTWFQDLLSDGLGGGSVTNVGGTVTSATSAISLTPSGTTLTSGNIIRVGVLGDGRAEG